MPYSDSDSASQVTMKSLLDVCVARHASPLEFRALSRQIMPPQQSTQWISAANDLHTANKTPDLVVDYVVECAASVFAEITGLTHLWTVLDSCTVEFQQAVLNRMVNSTHCVAEVARHLTAAQSSRALVLSFFANLQRYMGSSSPEVAPHLIYFIHCLVEQLQQSRIAVVPKSFFDKLYEFNSYNSSVSRSMPSLNHLTADLDNKLKSCAYTPSGSVHSTICAHHNTSRIFKLVWLTNAIRSCEALNESFMTRFAGYLKCELRISGINQRLTQDDLRMLVIDLVQTAIESFCICICNQNSPSLLRKWSVFIDKQLPLFILYMKAWTEDVAEEGSEKQWLQVKSEPLAHISGGIAEAIELLSPKYVAVLRIFAAGNPAQNEWIVNRQQYPMIDYLKIMEGETSVPAVGSNVVDCRFNFLKSCVALKLMTKQDFSACLKQDAEHFDVKLLIASDIIKDMNTSQTVHDIKKYIKEIFLDKNPEFEAVESSKLARFVLQIPNFEATSQYKCWLVILDTVEQLIAGNKSVYLRRIALSLLLNLQSLDIGVYFFGPERLIKMLCKHLAATYERQEEEDPNFQETFTDFGCIFLLVMFAIKRYKLSKDLVKDIEHVLVDFGGFPGSSEAVDQAVLSKWAKELFYSSSGLSDELLSKSSVKQCYKLATEIFKQAFLAYTGNVIDVELFKNGIEYFFQPFLLVPLLGMFHWFIDILWSVTPGKSEEDQKIFESVMTVMNSLVLPTVNEEARTIHGLIIQYISPNLIVAINSATENQLTKKATADQKVIRVLYNTVQANEFWFNLRLSSTNYLFGNEYSPLNLNSFESLELQIGSMVTCCLASSSGTAVPKFDPDLVMLMIDICEAKSVVQFLLQLVTDLGAGLKRGKINNSDNHGMQKYSIDIISILISQNTSLDKSLSQEKLSEQVKLVRDAVGSCKVASGDA